MWIGRPPMSPRGRSPHADGHVVLEPEPEGLGRRLDDPAGGVGGHDLPSLRPGLRFGGGDGPGGWGCKLKRTHRRIGAVAYLAEGLAGDRGEGRPLVGLQAAHRRGHGLHGVGVDGPSRRHDLFGENRRVDDVGGDVMDRRDARRLPLDRGEEAQGEDRDEQTHQGHAKASARLADQAAD